MWDAQNLVVISDLHLGPEHGKGLFQADAALAGFLGWLVEQEGSPAQVVIAGDLFDFLVPEHENEKVPLFDPATAAGRAARILDYHPEVVQGLARLATSPRHQLTVLGGNHDPELILPSVQHEIERRLGTPIRWLVHGEAARFRVGAAEVLVEHGDLFDDWNRIDRDQLRRALSRVSRGFVKEHGFKVPPGSQLVVDFTTELRKDYPWIEFLKPEREAVIPILDHILPLKRKGHLRSALGPWLGQKANALATLGLNTLGPAYVLARAPETEVSKRKRLADWLAARQRESRERRRATDRRQLIHQLREVSAENGYFDIEVHDDAAPQVARILDHGTDLVIHGHTHAAKAYPLGKRGLYLNSGTWGQLLELPSNKAMEEEWVTFLETLEQSRAKSAERPTFALVRQGEDGATKAQLLLWTVVGEQVLSEFSVADAAAAWSKEDR